MLEYHSCTIVERWIPRNRPTWIIELNIWPPITSWIYVCTLLVSNTSIILHWFLDAFPESILQILMQKEPQNWSRCPGAYRTFSLERPTPNAFKTHARRQLDFLSISAPILVPCFMIFDIVFDTCFVHFELAHLQTTEHDSPVSQGCCGYAPRLQWVLMSLVALILRLFRKIAKARLKRTASHFRWF